MSVFDVFLRAEADWKVRRDGLAVTFLSVATPLSLAVAMPSQCLPWLKASIYACSLGTLLSILEKRWRGPRRLSEEEESRKGLFARAVRRSHEWLYLKCLGYASRCSSLLLFVSLVCLLVAVALR